MDTATTTGTDQTVKIEDVLNGANPAALHMLADELRRDDGMTDMTALQMYAWLKRVQALTSTLMQNLVQRANSDFVQISAANANAKNWMVTDFATASRLTPPGTWTYPQDIAKLEAELKAKKESMKITEEAHYTPGVHDQTKDVVFKIHLKAV